MFNNSFSSFKDIVTKAKNERQSHDKLLIISTPHERSLFAAITIIIAGLLLWMFTIEVSSSISTDTRLYRIDQDMTTAKVTFKTVIRLEERVADKVGIGSVITFSSPKNILMQSVQGEVVTPIKLSPVMEIVPIPLKTSEFWYEIQFSLQNISEEFQEPFIDGILMIQLDDQLPFELLGMR